MENLLEEHGEIIISGIISVMNVDFFTKLVGG